MPLPGHACQKVGQAAERSQWIEVQPLISADLNRSPPRGRKRRKASPNRRKATVAKYHGRAGQGVDMAEQMDQARAFANGPSAWHWPGVPPWMQTRDGGWPTASPD